MRVRFLGTGTSHGVPMIGCACAVCRSPDPRNQRLRPAVCVATERTQVLVDAPPDFRTQALRAGLDRLDAVVITHTHADHVLGLDDLRVFCANGKKLPVCASSESLAVIQRLFPYACTATTAWPGLPSFALEPIQPFVEFTIGDLPILPLPLPHGQLPVLGCLFGRELAYLTDCSAVPEDVSERVRGVTVLAIDGLRHRPHPTHLTIAQALAVRERLQPRFTFLTHLCHDIDHATLASSLPDGVQVAYDGLELAISDGEMTVVNAP